MNNKYQEKNGQAMLREAMKNPGIKEVMEVFSNWQQLDSATRNYTTSLKIRPIVNSSNSSS